jgi:hypothetical protein
MVDHNYEKRSEIGPYYKEIQVTAKIKEKPTLGHHEPPELLQCVLA